MRRALLAATVLLAACAEEGSSNLSQPGPCKDRVVWEGTPGAQVQMDRHLGTLIVVPAKVDGVEKQVLLDSGAPVSALDPASFGASADADSSWQPDVLEIAGVKIKRPELLPTQLIAGTGLGGLIGGDLLCAFALSIDYRAGTFALGRTDAPADAAAPVSVSFALEGGLDFEGLDLHIPATRIPVKVDVEGQQEQMLLDTGASITALRAPVFARISGDGRRITGGLPAITVMGSTMLRVARSKRLALSGAEVAAPLIGEVGTQVDFTTLENEVGHPIAGLLGTSFLRAFHTTIDYPAGVLELRAYPTASLAPDDLTRVGVVLDDGAVAFVFEGSEAAQRGMRQGTRVSAIDGTPLAGLDAAAVDDKLRGPLGRTVTLTTTSGDVPLRVEDLVPLMP